MQNSAHICYVRIFNSPTIRFISPWLGTHPLLAPSSEKKPLFASLIGPLSNLPEKHGGARITTSPVEKVWIVFPPVSCLSG